MSVFLPTPTYALPVIVEEKTGIAVFNPIWLDWFLRLAESLTAAGAGSGSVTSVNASGGTTGLSFTGGPVVTAGTLTLSGVLLPANGGFDGNQSYARGSFTIPTAKFSIMSKRLALTSTQRGVLQGTSRLSIT